MEDRILTSQELARELSELPSQKFFRSGNKFLDELIGGFAEGDLIIVGGSPKAGKTTLLQTWTKQFAEQDIPCLWFSIELSNREFLGRFGDNLPIFWLPRVMPTTTTHQWLEKKILEAKLQKDIKMVFIDHIGILTDEAMYRERNPVEILDARLLRLKRFALKNRICIICIAPLVSTSLRKKKTEPSTSDFRGTAMVGYSADTLMVLDRLAGANRTVTVNEEYSDVEALTGGIKISSDAYLYILDSRRTGVRKVRIKMLLGNDNNLTEV